MQTRVKTEEKIVARSTMALLAHVERSHQHVRFFTTSTPFLGFAIEAGL